MNYFYLTGTPVTTSDRDKQISTFIPMKFAKRSGRSVVTTVEDAMKVTAPHEPLPDTTLMNALAKAFHWQRCSIEASFTVVPKLHKKRTWTWQLSMRFCG
jgi:hypothetical protein